MCDVRVEGDIGIVDMGRCSFGFATPEFIDYHIKNLVALDVPIKKIIYEEEISFTLDEEKTAVLLEYAKVLANVEALRLRKEIYGKVLEELLQLKFTERAVGEFLKLPSQKKRLFLKELLRFSQREGKENVEPLATVPSVYKLRFSGGRVYLRKQNGSWEVVGLLGSEDDKEKERYIRNVLSKID